MRDITLLEVHEIVKHLQGEILTFIEAIYPEGSQRKAVKDTINSQVSRALSYAQDYAWRRYDAKPDGQEAPCTHTASHLGSCKEFDESQK